MSALHVERSGEQHAALPVVMVHGWAMNAAVWGGFAEAFGRFAEVFRLELPGHGRSPWTGGNGLNDWARQALEVVPQPALWIGWSLGALLVLRIALDRPAAVRALVLIAGTPRFVQAEDWRHAMAPELLERFGAGLLADPRATVERFLALQVRGAQAATATLRRLRTAVRALPTARREALVAGLDVLRATDLRPELRSLEPPSLWLLGARDTLVPAAVGPELGAWLPRATVEVVEGAGHAPFLSHSAHLLARIRRWPERPDGA